MPCIKETSAIDIMKNGLKAGEGGSVFATPYHRTAVEYGFGALLTETKYEETPDAKFAVVHLKQNTPGFHIDNPSSVTDDWQHTAYGDVPAKYIEKIEVYDAWKKYSDPIEILYPPTHSKSFQSIEKSMYTVVLITPK